LKGHSAHSSWVRSEGGFSNGVAEVRGGLCFFEFFTHQGSTLMSYLAKGFGYVSATCFCLIALGSQTIAAPLEIKSATSLFTPSFRGASNTNWFGWGPGKFEGASENDLIDSPPQTLNTIDPPAGYNLIQNNSSDYVSGSNNIYTGGSSLDATLTVPTNGIPGTGFTTIIIQGRTAFGMLPGGDYGSAVTFANIAGASPVYVQGTRTSGGTGQFWVKYEIPGNASYAVNIPASENDVSIAELVVDTHWSLSGYAPDTAIVPEPATWAMLAIGMIPELRKCRKALYK
jgi:hypothetical protein